MICTIIIHRNHTTCINNKVFDCDWASPSLFIYHIIGAWSRRCPYTAARLQKNYNWTAGIGHQHCVHVNQVH